MSRVEPLSSMHGNIDACSVFYINLLLLRNGTIEDNGGGIDESIIKTLFKPYVSTKSLNGTGLGLYISKTIIQDHFNGTLKAVNTKKGSEIYHLD